MNQLQTFQGLHLRKKIQKKLSCFFQFREKEKVVQKNQNMSTGKKIIHICSNPSQVRTLSL